MAESVNISALNTQIDSLRKRAAQQKSTLKASPTGYGGTSSPSFSDISGQRELEGLQNQVQSLTDQRLKAQWYDKDIGEESGESKPRTSLVGKAIDFINRPIYGMVGAAKHVVGQGSGSLLEDIADNMVRNKETFADVLKDAGVPYGVAAPLGFALDMTFDPFNWLTAGTAALVPRAAMGLSKGLAKGGLTAGAKGLASGLESGFLNKATMAARFTPGLRKSEAFGSLAKKAVQSTSSYEQLTGRTAEAIVRERGFGIGSKRILLGDLGDKMVDVLPNSIGSKVREFGEHFKYDPTDWVRQARIKDEFKRSLGSNLDDASMRRLVAAKLKGEDITPLLKEASQAQEQKILQISEDVATRGEKISPIDFDSPPNVSLEATDLAVAKLAGTSVLGKVIDEAPAFVRQLDDAAELMNNPHLGFTTDQADNALRIVNEKIGGPTITMQEIGEIIKSNALGETGVRWYDNMLIGIKNYKYAVGKNQDKILVSGKAVMDTYEKAIAAFKASKVGASLTAWVNGVIGNVTMSMMMGINVADPAYLSKIGMAGRFARNKAGSAAAIDDLLKSIGQDRGDMIRTFLAENPTAARGYFGDINKALLSGEFSEQMLKDAQKAGLVDSALKLDDLTKGSAEYEKELKDLLSKLPKGESPLEGGNQGTAYLRDLISKGKEVDKFSATGYVGSEMLMSSASQEMFDAIAKKAANSSNPLWKIADFTMNKMPSGYEAIDQTAKLSSFLYLTTDGLTMGELSKMRHFVDIAPETLEAVTKDGVTRYLLSPKTAMEAAGVAYLNYSAMPSAIKVLRNMPLMGSPFASFMYGMALKTGQTMAYNPGVFTKINMAMNDFGGQKSPIEKKALESSFSSYLKQPGMFRVPFFDENPLYLNLANVIPYYSLNIFETAQRSYSGGSAMEGLANIVSASPFFKDPMGSTMFDYIIQPMILSDAIQPKGAFGQSLYPKESGILSKAAYGARSLGEAFVPNVLSYAGLVTPESIAPVIPSYRWRQLAYAKEGKNQYGISSKEPKTSRVLRGVLSASGIPVQASPNLKYVKDQ